MEKSALIFVSVLILAGSHSVSQWQTYQTPVQSAFAEVCVVNPNIIWACGSFGSVVRTTNAGINWNVVNNGLPAFNYFHISAISENTAWITGGAGDQVFRTTNGGLNWTEQFYIQPFFINKLHFFNANTGIFLRDPPGGNFDTCGFFITRNGGTNWVYSPNSPITTILIDNCMGVLDTNFIWFCDNDKLYKLTGGLNGVWQTLNNGLNYAYQTAFVNSNTGFTTDAIRLTKTTNGGNTWTEIATGLGSGTYSLIGVPGSNMLVATSINSMRISYNLGNSWEPVVSYLLSDSVRISYCDAADTSSIWVAVNKGRLFKYNFAYIGISQLGTEIPVHFNVHQNFPNPFNPSTKIRFELPTAGEVYFTVYDLLGRSIYRINEFIAPGTYEVNFEGSALASGVYYYRINSDAFSETRKMIFLK